MRIAVTGGKGGIGKTFISVLLSKELSEKNNRVLFVDADVTNPNANTFFKYKLRRLKYVYKRVPYIDKKKCKKCGICAKKCRMNAIAWAPGNYPIIMEDLCKGCMLCKFLCPFGAIKEKKKRVGEIKISSEKKNPILIEGLLFPGEREEERVVEELIEVSRNFNPDFVIFDTSAGIRCDVLRVLEFVDKILVVVEPSPFGVSDFTRILEILKDLNKEFFVVINKKGLGWEKSIYNLSKENGFEILLEIPNNLEIARKISVGEIPRINLGDVIEYLSS